MMSNRKLLLPVLVLALGSSPRSDAGNIVIDNVNFNDSRVSSLEITSQRYVDAMRVLIGTRYRKDYRAIRWEDMERAMASAKLARFEYHYVDHGVPKVRIYHAMGGEPLGLLGRTVFEGPTRPGTPSSLTSLDSLTGEDDLVVEKVASNADRVSVDAEDEAFYAGFNETDVRARVLPADNSILTSFPVDEQDRALDPEFKLLRQIEHDIQGGIVPAGGSIQGSVGGTICASCHYAMQRLSDTYSVDLRISQMFASLPKPEQQALIRDGRARLKGGRLVDPTSGRPLLAYDALRSARSEQIRQTLSPGVMRRSFKGIQHTSPRKGAATKEPPGC